MIAPRITARSHRSDLGGGLVVEIVIDRHGRLSATWSPAIPTTMTDAQFRVYRAARDSLLADVAAEIGRSVLAVEV